MKSPNALLSAPFILRVVGYILIISSLLDYVTLLATMNFQDKQSLGMAITQLVDRGVIPMIGLALALTGSWLEANATGVDRAKPFTSLKFWALAISGLLGLLFLLAVPLHFNNTANAADDAVKAMNAEADKATGQLTSQVEQRKTQLGELLKNPTKFDEESKKLDEALASGQIPPEQLPQLQQLQKDLKELKANPSLLETKAKESSDKALIQIRDQKQKKEQQIRGEALRINLKTGLSGLLLAIGYTLISWVGLADMGLFTKPRRQAPPPL
jgi:hypothetical protein